jgi:thiamine-monophosphate kinase
MPAEDKWIHALISEWPPMGKGIGPGDDAAVIPPPARGKHPVLKTDAVVEGVHFLPRDPGPAIGHKALGRAISDFAAMAAHPRYALITLGLNNRTTTLRKLRAVYRGMARLARTHHIRLAGGELTQSRNFWISVTLVGDVDPKQTTTRCGGCPGDHLLVTGKLGGSFPKRHLSFQPRLEEGLWLGSRPGVHAMMDLSDGLGKDLPRLASASDCSFSINPQALPRHRGTSIHQAINDGEDYELLIAVDPKRVDTLKTKWPFKTSLTEIGKLTNPSQKDETGGYNFCGWDHLKRAET